MNYPTLKRPTRATRINLQGKILVSAALENGRQLPAKLHKLSMNGGLLEIATYVEERTKVSLTIAMGGNVVRPMAEMLFPLWSATGYLQPFRFVHMWREERQVLEAEIEEFLRRGVARTTMGKGTGFHAPGFFLEST